MQRVVAKPTLRCSCFVVTAMAKLGPLWHAQTMKRSEVELLLKLLPRYYAHVERYPHTLLIKFFGLHRVKPASGGKVQT